MDVAQVLANDIFNRMYDLERYELYVHVVMWRTIGVTGFTQNRKCSGG